MASNCANVNEFVPDAVVARHNYNGHRAHAALDGRTPDPRAGADSARGPGRARASVCSYRWQVHCRGLYQTPIAA